MLSLEQLMQEALSLPNESRALLAEKLIESLESDTDPKIEAVWITEAKRRRDEICSKDVEPILGKEALAKVRKILGQTERGLIQIQGKPISETIIEERR